MVNFGLLTAEICWRVWGTPANFNGFGVLAALLCGTLVVGVSQTLQRWTEDATYIRQGDHHVGHWPTFYCDISCELECVYCMLLCVTAMHSRWPRRRRTWRGCRSFTHRRREIVHPQPRISRILHTYITIRSSSSTWRAHSRVLPCSSVMPWLQAHSTQPFHCLLHNSRSVCLTSCM